LSAVGDQFSFGQSFTNDRRLREVMPQQTTDKIHILFPASHQFRNCQVMNLQTQAGAATGV
jgi:hypothetical protein